MLPGENQDRARPPQSGAESPSGGERPRKWPDDRATRAACGAQSPGPPVAATEERVRLTSSLSVGLARLAPPPVLPVRRLARAEHGAAGDTVGPGGALVGYPCESAWIFPAMAARD